MSRFSIIIPFRATGSPKPLQRFEDTLASVLRNSEHAQVIVPVFGDYEDPHGLTGEVKFVESDGKHLAQLFNSGLKAAKGEFVFLLRPGVEPRDDWQAVVGEAFADPEVASVSPAIEDPASPGKLVTAGVATNFRYSRRLIGKGKRSRSRASSKLKPIGPTSWAGCYRKSLLTSLDYFEPTLDSAYLDLDLALSLKTLQFKNRFAPQFVAKATDPDLIESEAAKAHGKSAQRALRRHSGFNPTQRRNSALAAMALELLSTPICPANFKHAWQRLSTGKTKLVDQQHQELISVLLSQHERLIESGLKIHTHQPEPNLVRQNVRKAA